MEPSWKLEAEWSFQQNYVRRKLLKIAKAGSYYCLNCSSVFSFPLVHFIPPCSPHPCIILSGQETHRHQGGSGFSARHSFWITIVMYWLRAGRVLFKWGDLANQFAKCRNQYQWLYWVVFPNEFILNLDSKCAIINIYSTIMLFLRWICIRKCVKSLTFLFTRMWKLHILYFNQQKKHQRTSHDLFILVCNKDVTDWKWLYNYSNTEMQSNSTYLKQIYFKKQQHITCGQKSLPKINVLFSYRRLWFIGLLKVTRRLIICKDHF